MMSTLHTLLTIEEIRAIWDRIRPSANGTPGRSRSAQAPLKCTTTSAVKHCSRFSNVLAHVNSHILSAVLPTPKKSSDDGIFTCVIIRIALNDTFRCL